MVLHRLLATLLVSGAATSAIATEPASSASPSRYTLRQGEAAATQRSEQYEIRARFAPAESAGELRESGRFALIGRFAKAASQCGPTGDAIFRNGFEG